MNHDLISNITSLKVYPVASVSRVSIRWVNAQVRCFAERVVSGIPGFTGAMGEG
jgi:NAD-dependent SIR2 family protein deacetylase